MNYRNIIYSIMGLIALAACSSSEAPTYLEPHLSTLAATDITRTEATLNGTATVEGTTEMPLLNFRYGTTAEMSLTSNNVKATNGNVSLKMLNLKAGTTYYYMLQGSNGRTTTTSNTMSFTTDPNVSPKLGELSLLSHGPTSAIVSYEITDDGGEAMTETGCYVYLSTDKENKQLCAVANFDGKKGKQKLRIGNLQRNSSYEFIPFAKNTVGETTGNPITYATTDAIMLEEAGVLAHLMGNNLYEYTTLTVAGPMNGTDLSCLRQMMGRNPDESATNGKLADIDMTDVKIVAGGDSYGSSRYTQDGVIGQGLFADCTRLTHIVLPAEATTLEKDAFASCTSLQKIEIAAGITSLLPSQNCTALQDINVSSANANYSSKDGVLLNADGTQIVWFPMGKKGEYDLPATITSISDYAFKQCSIETFRFPDGLKDIGQGAFMDSKIKEVKLPANLKTISTGTFQNCHQLKVVRLGAKAEQICAYAFDGCPLTDIYITSTYPPTCLEHAFDNTDGSNYTSTCVLHVPAGKKKIYQIHKMWGKFKNIVEQ